MGITPRKGELSQDGSLLFSDKVVDRLTAAVPDCCLLSSDGAKYPVHKVKLREQSTVLRGLLSDLAERADQLPLEEDAATVRLLISGMYDASSPVSWSTVEPMLELARKYNVEDIQLNCQRFLDTMPLSASNLPRCMELASTFEFTCVLARCQDYIATAGTFANLVRVHGEDWCKDLPGRVVTKIMARRLKAVITQCEAKTEDVREELLMEMEDKEARYKKLLAYVVREVPMDKHERREYKRQKQKLGL